MQEVHLLLIQKEQNRHAYIKEISTGQVRVLKGTMNHDGVIFQQSP